MYIHTYIYMYILSNIYIYIYTSGVAGSIMLIVVGNKHGDPSLKPMLGCLHFT